MILDVLVYVCLAVTALIIMVGPITSKDINLESSLKILTFAALPALATVILVVIRRFV